MAGGPLDALYEGTTSVVLGATGALGQILCRRILTAGGKLGLAARSAASAARVAREHEGAAVLAAAVPPGDGEAAAGFVKGVEDSLGEVGALFCLAGAFEMGPIGEEKERRLARMVEANLTASYTMCRALAPVLRARGRGRIVLVGSRSVLRPAGSAAAYAAAKGAVHALCAALAEELGPAGVAVNLVAPSIMDTPANRRAMPDADPTRWTPLEEVAHAVLFLGSPLARSLRGSVLVPAGRGG